MEQLVAAGWNLKDEIWRDIRSASSEASLQGIALDVDLRKVSILCKLQQVVVHEN